MTGKGEKPKDVNGITIPTQAETDLRISQQKYQALIESTGDFIWEIDAAGRYTYCSPQMETLWDLKPEEMIGKTPFDLMPDEQREKVSEQFKGMSENPVPYSGMEIMSYDKRGNLVHLEVSGVPFFDNEGKFLGYRGVTRDITKRKKAEDALRDSDNLLRAVIDNSPDAIYVKDHQSRWLMANPAVLHIVDKTEKEALGKTDLDLYVDPSIGHAILDNDRRILEKGRPFAFEEIADTPEGRRIFLSIKAPRFDDRGNIVGLVGISHDITENKEAQEELKRRNEILFAFNRILESSFSHQSEEVFCMSILEIVEEITGSRISFIGEIGPDGFLHDLAISNPGWDACRMHDSAGHRRSPGNFPVHGIYGRVLTDGKSLIVNDPASHPDSVGLPPGHPPLDNFLGVPLTKKGKAVGMIAVGNRDGGYRIADLETLESLVPAVVGALDRKRAETARAEAETMIRNSNMMLEREVNLRTTELKSAILELEEFNYSIAHDLRAPLRHISGYIGMIQRKLAGMMDAKTSQYMEVVSASADNMGSLIDSILDLSRISRSSLVYTRVNMDEIVSEARKILEREPGYCNVTWKTGPLPVVEGDAVMLSTIMINLLSNALKFSRTATAPVIEIGQQEGHPGYDVIYVKDNGIGFDMKYYSKLYKLFERLCPEKGYEGTGIGLVNVKRIILKHGGRTWAEGEDGKGAVFYFSLPKR